jgi:hypothetical protein
MGPSAIKLESQSDQDLGFIFIPKLFNKDSKFYFYTFLDGKSERLGLNFSVKDSSRFLKQELLFSAVKSEAKQNGDYK